MYSLRVFYSDESVPRQLHNATTPNEAMHLIPKLLAEHDGCERVEAHYGGGKLFAMDCKGDRMPD